jgi:hypothetical protein
MACRHFLPSHAEDTTPAKYYAAVAFSYLVASFTAQKALTWVSYPAQVTGFSKLQSRIHNLFL